MSGRRAVLVATILGSSLAFIDIFVVNVALPTIERDFDIGLSGEQWIVLSYSLALASLYLLGGSLGDRVGRREAFVAGVVGFVAASALAGAAPNAGVLIAARALQGVAGAVLTPTSLGLLRASFAEESGRAIGLWTSWTAVATIAGPPIGGALVEWTSWRLIFFLNVPLGAVAIALALAGAPRRETGARPGRIDVAGAALAAAGFGALTFGLVEAGRESFGAPAAWGPLVAGAALLAAFVAVEARAEEPMLPLDLFRSRAFSAANAETLLFYAALSGGSFFVPLYLQSIGLSPFASGWLLAPTSFVLLALAAPFGRLADRRGARLPLTVGPLVAAAGLGLYCLLSPTASWATALPGALVLGLGLAITVAPITATALRAVPERHAGVAAGVNATTSRVGSLLAVAVIGIVVASVFDARVESPGAVALGKNQHGAVAAASTDAFRAGMAVASALALGAGAVALAAIRD